MESSPIPEAGDTGEAVQRDWSARTRRVATVLWCSFLAAAAATAIFFAFVDPIEVLDAIAGVHLFDTRMPIYSLGFFAFWAVCAVSSGLTAVMLLTDARDPKSSAVDSHRNRGAA